MSRQVRSGHRACPGCCPSRLGRQARSARRAHSCCQARLCCRAYLGYSVRRARPGRQARLGHRVVPVIGLVRFVGHV